MNLHHEISSLRRLLTLLAVILGLASGMSGAANYNLRFVNPGNCPAKAIGANATVGSSCRYTNVVVDAAGNPLPAASTYQRDVIVTLSKLTGGAVVTGTTTNPDAWDNDKLQLDATGPFRPEFFTPTVTSPDTAGATAWAEFTFQFVPAGGVSTTTTPLPGTFYMTSFDTDGNNTTLREFIEFVGPSASGVSVNPASADQLGAAVDGGTNYEAITDANQPAIGSGAAYKASAQFATPGIVKFVVGARQGATSCNGACERLSTYSFQVADSVVLYPSVDGSKSVKLTTDADGNGVVSPGDTLTYTVTYTNTGNAAETGFQITDALPAGVTITAAGAQTVRLNGTVTAGARNTGYTGTGATNLLAAGQTLPVGGSVSVSIPVTVNAVAADNTVLSNQTGSSGSYTNAAGTSLPAPAANSDNVDSTTVFPPSTAATTGFGTVPAGSVAQTQVASIDPATVNVRRLPTLTLNKTIAAPGRVNAADQFTVQIKNGATVTASASTTGTGTTAATGVTSLSSGTPYSLTEVMAAGSVSALSSYNTVVSCTNSTAGSATTLPSGAGQSFTLTPALGDVISCTLTNTPRQNDLAISKTGPTLVTRGGTLNYTIKVWNIGPDSVTGAVIADTVPTNLTGVTWTCAASGSATCGTASGSGNSVSFASGLLPVNNTATAPTSGSYLTITVTGTASTAGNITNTATVTTPAGSLDPASGNNSSSQATTISIPNIPPTTADVTNAALVNTAPATVLSPNLSATDSDGTVASYTIVTLPAAASGVLSVNGAVVTAGQTFTAAQLGTLSFAPKAGFNGNASFTYSATDNLGAVSNTSTYTIPVQPSAPVTCSAMYVLSGSDGTSNGIDIRLIDETTNVFGGLVTQIPSTTTGQVGYSAALAIGIGGTKIFAARDQDRALLVYDVATGVWTNVGTLTAGTAVNRIVRMAVGPDGTGYAMDGAGSFYTFKQNGASYTITGPTTITVSPATSPAFGGSGDFFADAQGRLFLLSSPGGVNYLDFFEISPASGTAAYLGRINDPDINNVNYGGYAATVNGIYGRSSTGRLIRIDLANLAVTTVDATANTVISTDLASCYFPTYNRALTANKTAAKVAGSAGPNVQVGDTLEYSIIVRNSGTLTTGGVTFQDNIPAGTTYVANSTTLNTAAVADAAGAVMPFVAAASVSSPGQGDGILLADTTPAITTDREATVKFRVTVNAGATSVSNQGTVKYLDGTTKTQLTDDPNTPAPNDPTVSLVGGKLAISKVGPAYFKPGDTLSYTLTVTNTGTAATGVGVTDTLPAGLTFVSASNGGTYDAGTRVVTWTLGNVANGATVTLTLTATAPAAASVETNNGPTSLVNNASVQSDQTAAVAATPATSQLVYPKLTKRVRNVTQSGTFGTVGTGKPGEVLEYCIDFRNYGVGVASFVISDSVPSNTNANLDAYGTGLGLQVVRGTTTTRTSTGGDADGGSLSAAALSLDLGTLVAAESGSVCFQSSIK